MYLASQRILLERLRAVLHSSYQLELGQIAVEQPPAVALGEYALPVAFELARRLRKPPRAIAAELVAALGPLPGFAGFEVAGAGYINARLDRPAAVAAIAAGISEGAAAKPVHSLVEHTSINPNKAAHVGHLRNAILGDTFVRLLRAAGQTVDVQNYIDNTGVQVADIAVGLEQLEKLELADVRRLLAELAAAGIRVDYYCWDLYARVSQWYGAEADPGEQARRRQLRLDTLHRIEQGGNPTAEIADLIATAVLRRHLETMQRIGIEYDFLPRESEILHLDFWDLAFEQLRTKGVLYFEERGKNRGCWVMRRAGSEADQGRRAGGEPEAEKAPAGEGPAGAENGDEADSSPDGPGGDHPGRDDSGPDEDAKVIVRSNGTVTYVGKDIAYHLWKFGLLGRDFGYRRFFRYPDHECWISAESGEAAHPRFGGADAIYNVIDARQSDPQANVIEALRGLGYREAAEHYTHFSYEMVALTPRCALELGYQVAEEDRARAYIEVSGRKGFGVKADDLIDRLMAATQAEVAGRHPQADANENRAIAAQIAIGALRYFMLKYTRNTVIAFDFRDALSFEGETGPYVQYAAVRARNIFRKAGLSAEDALAAVASVPPAALAAFVAGAEGDEIWSLWLRASRRSQVLEQCLATSEPAHLARHGFQLAQEFNNFYHRHHILTEQDADRRALLLATAAVVLRELVTVLGWLGIEAPARM